MRGIGNLTVTVIPTQNGEGRRATAAALAHQDVAGQTDAQRRETALLNDRSGAHRMVRMRLLSGGSDNSCLARAEGTRARRRRRKAASQI